MRIFLIFLILLPLLGCNTPKKTVEPPLPPRQAWWKAFHDPLMDRLAEQLLAENLDIKIARARIEEARALHKMSSAGLFPEINAVASGTRSNSQIGSQKPANIAQGRFDASWEVDILGRAQEGIKAARAREEVAVVTAENIRDIVLADLFRAIITWRQASQGERQMSALLENQEEQVALFTTQTQAGLRDASFLSRASAARSETAANIPPLTTRKISAKYQIERLLGKEVKLTPDDHRLILPPVKETLDINIKTLEHRPDIRAAKASLLAAQADLKQAEADLWPSLRLSGFYGAQDVSKGVVTAGNPIWLLGSSLTMPLLNFGRLQAAVDNKNAAAKEALLTYQNTVLLALQETRTALSDYLEGINAVHQTEAALEARKETVSLAKERFERGLTDMVDLTTASVELEQTTLKLLEQQELAAIAYIRLQKALGGFPSPLNPL